MKLIMDLLRSLTDKAEEMVKTALGDNTEEPHYLVEPDPFDRDKVVIRRLVERDPFEGIAQR